MQVFFLHHSAAAAAMEKSLLVFDHYRHAADKGMEQGHVSDGDIEKAGRAYVFASHAHADHFNPRIFEWARLDARVKYILDGGIGRPEGVDAVSMNPGDTFDDGYIMVKAFGSTDIGSSFYVECEGKRLFHAGDLNFWHWRGEGDAAYTRQMAADFEREMAQIEQNVDKIDAAFFPVDKRMGAGHDEGADMFIDRMKPDVFVPIHLVDFGDARAFADKHAGSGTRVLTPEHNGQRIL